LEVVAAAPKVRGVDGRERILKLNRWLILGGGAILLVGAILARSRVHFQWGVFFGQVRHVDWTYIAFGIAMIALGYVLRAVRWAVLLKPKKRVSSFSLFGSQVIGFAAVALFGRLADLVRPYLAARRTQLSVSSQIAVYAVERMFDLGAMALIFSGALLLAPDRASLPHHEALRHAAMGGLAMTVALGIVALCVRIWGKPAGRLAACALQPISAELGESVEMKIHSFRDGLDAIDSFGDFVLSLLISLVMWCMITAAYLATARAFVSSPQLSSMSLARCMVLMAASMVTSIVQLPVIGWFTQIGVTTGVMESIFDVPFEPALACAAMLLLVTFMTVIPLGLIWARVEHVSIKKLSEESEHLLEEAAAPSGAVSEA
jgi:hypothetical protein